MRDDLKAELKILQDMMAGPGWELYVRGLTEEVERKLNEITMPPSPDRSPNIKEYLSGVNAGLLFARGWLAARIDELTETIEMDEKESANGREGGDGFRFGFYGEVRDAGEPKDV